MKSALGYPRDQIELVAARLRGAAHALGRLTGTIDVEDVLDAIFKDFCIGK
jgi:tRNA modification GTPase